jgi:hypothetical protein
MTPRRFTVRGSRNGSLVHVTWAEGGTITGDPPTVDLLHTQAEMLSTLRNDNIGMRAYPELAQENPTNPLDDPATAHRLIAHVLDSIRDAYGDLPEDTSTAQKARAPRHNRDGKLTVIP